MVAQVTPKEAPSELEQFGEGLKAAVASGAMTREDAWSLWRAAQLASELEKKDGSATNPITKIRSKERGDETLQISKATPKSRINRLVPPWPHRIDVLLHPQFMVRDAYTLGDWLDLDEDRVAIIEMVLTQHELAWEEATTVLTDALNRYAHRKDRATLQFAAERFNRDLDFDDIDIPSVAVDLARRRWERSQSKNKNSDSPDSDRRHAAIEARAAKVREWLTPRLKEMNTRLEAIRNQVEYRLLLIDESASDMSAEDIVELAENLQRQRQSLAIDVREMLTLAIDINDDDEMTDRLGAALARLRIEDGYRYARLGGESIRPWGILAAAFRGVEIPPMALVLVDSHRDELSDLVKDRTHNAINREIEGWRFLVRRAELIEEHGDDDNVTREQWLEALEPYVATWKVQIESSIAYRDALLQLVEETTNQLAEDGHPLVDQYEVSAMRTGFALEMRPRWVETALKAAMSLDDLDDETMAELANLDLKMREELAEIRADAIQRRLTRDPELALTDVVAFWGKNVDRSKAYTDEDWRGFAHDRHAALTDHTWSSLQSLLTDDQLAAVPERPEKETSKKESSKKESSKDK
jgi:hypothetical protein